MKLTKEKLRQIIREAMYDPRTLPRDYIPASMVAMDPEIGEKISTLSRGGEESYNQAELLAKPPAVIDMAGSYKGALKKADRISGRELIDIMKTKDYHALLRAGFRFVANDFLSGYERMSEQLEEEFEFQAMALGDIGIENLAFLDLSRPPGSETYKMISGMLENLEGVEVPDPSGNHGENILYNLDGVKILVTYNYGAYITIGVHPHR